ncbi:MAG: 30S ribosomal protein S6 [Anaerolineae bacterium]|nr:30S ribosomal protein S6 [Anaerolineae bacterium]
MNRPYELGFIISISVSENDTADVIASVQETIEKLDGSVTKVNFWGRRRLAYPIQDFREGYYVFLNMDYPTEQIGELERILKLDDRVIRHLVVRLDEDQNASTETEDQESEQPVE